MNNTLLVNKLKRDVEGGRVLTIAGTGVSIATCDNALVGGQHVASWTGLLRHGLDYCERIGAIEPGVAKILTMQIECGETDMLIAAAEALSQRLISRSRGVFHGWLKDSVGQLPVRDRGIVESLDALPGILATLNYDDLIERVTERHTVTWLESERIQEILRGERNEAVLHLHGAFTAPDSVVLGLGSYLSVRDHPHTRAVLQLATVGRSLLFVGCGDTLSDPNFTRLIEWSAAVLSDVTPRHFFLCRESEVTGLQGKLNHAPWLQVVSYGQQYSELCGFLRSLVTVERVSVRNTDSVPQPMDLNAYKQAMRKRYGRLKLEDLDPTTHDMQSLSLLRQYVTQDVQEWSVGSRRRAHYESIPPTPVLQDESAYSVLGVDLPADSEYPIESVSGGVEKVPRAATEILSDPQLDRLVILGDPGSGKSTLLQYLLLEAAEDSTTDDRLVLLIELREYARLRHNGEVSSFLDYLSIGAAARWHFNEGQLKEWLQSHVSVVLFDGLDEVFDSDLRNEVSVAIPRFADDYPRARVVMTSRKVDFRYQAWSQEKFRLYVLQELTNAQIDDFLERWHRAAYDDKPTGRQKMARLSEAVRGTPAIRRLAGNPLLLTMMAILSRTQELPRDRAELYEQCARLLLHQWKADLAFIQDPELARGSLDYHDKRGLLLRVASAMQGGKRGLAGNLIGEQALEKALADGLQGFPNIRPRRAARALIEQLRGRNFMLSSVGPRSYGFVHRTFLEYFCALDIRDRFQNEQVLTLGQLKEDVFGKWKDPAWHEVLCLLCGMLAPRFVAEILTWLADQKEQPLQRVEQPMFSSRGRVIDLAARCLSEVRRRNEIGETDALIRRSLEAAIHEDVNFRDLRSLIALYVNVWRSAPDIKSSLSAFMKPENGPQLRVYALQELARGWPEDPEVLLLLKTCAQSDRLSDLRAAAIVQLEQGWAEDPETLPLIRTRAEVDQEFDVRVSAVGALCRRWKGDPEIRGFLKGRLELDASSRVRQELLKGLGRDLAVDLDIQRLIKKCAHSDESGDARRVALTELMAWLGDHDELLALLKHRATIDEASYVRWTAIEQVAKRWADDPTTLTWLKSRGVSDSSSIARTTALTLIANRWSDDPQIQSWLEERAQSDLDGAVRKAARKALTGDA